MYSQGYFIDVQIVIAVLYGVYVTLLHQHVSYAVARWYLIFLLPTGLLIPLLNLPLLPAPEVATGVVFQNTPGVILSEELVVESAAAVNYYQWTYFIGLAVMSLWLLVGIVRLFILFQRNRVERIGKYNVIFVSQESYAYTILNYIFINKNFRDTPMLSELIAHEGEHIRFGHTYDLIYSSIMRVLFWFNPIVWHLRYLLRQVHEYQVDRSVIDKGYSLKNYVNLLIMSEAGISPEFTTPFGYSFTKKRITMLLKKNQTNSRGRLLVTIPVLAILLLAFAVTSKAAVALPTEEVLRDTTLNIFSKLQKEHVKVTVDDLRMKYPLIIIDGKTSTQEEMDALNMTNVKSVTILKDETATQLYGEAAADGVVIIEVMSPKKEVVVVDSTLKISTVHLVNKGRLCIIDGFEAKDEDYLKLPMGQVERLSVLDADTGKKIYGTRGAKGVIVVETTKTQLASGFVVKGIKKASFRADGQTNFNQWVQYRVKYPKESVDNNIKGEVRVEFYVEKDGKVNDVKAVKGPDQPTIEEVIRVVKTSPVWSPEQEDGNSVRSKQSVRIVFSM